MGGRATAHRQRAHGDGAARNEPRIARWSSGMFPVYSRPQAPSAQYRAEPVRYEACPVWSRPGLRSEMEMT